MSTKIRRQERWGKSHTMSAYNICCLFRHYMYVESNQSFYPKFKGGLYKR